VIGSIPSGEDRLNPPSARWIMRTMATAKKRDSLAMSRNGVAQAAAKRGKMSRTVSAQLPDGKWIAVELRPGCYATAPTQAAAEAAIRRKLDGQLRAIDEDAIDREVIRRRRRNERLLPFEELKRKHLK
jgi:hypothetical protein